MKKKYTQQSLNEFFEEFKSLPCSFKIEQVHQLLNNPHAKATHKVNPHFKLFKLIIMTSAFIIGILAVLFWQFPKESMNKVILTERQPIHIEHVGQDENKEVLFNNLETKIV